MFYNDGPTQEFAAVCGNGHIATDTLERVVEPGTHIKVPRLCKECSAPMFTRCTNAGCGAPIHGDIRYPNVLVAGRERRADWFCHKCGVPYLWATDEQNREWALNQIRFNQDLTDDEADDLRGMVAVLTDPEQPQPKRREEYRSFKERIDSLGQTAESLKPLVELFRMITLS